MLIIIVFLTFRSFILFKYLFIFLSLIFLLDCVLHGVNVDAYCEFCFVQCGPNTLYSMLFHLSSFKLLLIFLYIFTLYMFFFSLSPSLSLALTVFSKPISLFSIFHYSQSFLLFNLNIILFYIANHLTMYTKFSFNILTTLFYLIPAITHISSYNIFIRIRMLINIDSYLYAPQY